MKIGVVQMFNGRYNSFLGECIENVKAYCAERGYAYLALDGPIAGDCNINFQKPLLLLREIDKYDYIIWLDADLVIANNSIKFESIIKQYPREIYYCEDPVAELNSGVLIFKNSEYSKRILQKWWESRCKISKRGDQSKLIKILREEGFNALPERLMNSSAPNYIKGDFILHFMGQNLSFMKYKVYLFGERNVGTNWLKQLLKESFPGLEVWDGDKHMYNYESAHEFTGGNLCAEEYIKEIGLHNPLAVKIYLYKNPLSWLSSLRRAPYHAHDHITTKNDDRIMLPMADFLRKTWKEYGKSNREYHEGVHCDQHAEYDNAIQLRNCKNKIFKNLTQHINNWYVINYEDLLFNIEDTLIPVLEENNLKTNKLATIDVLEKGILDKKTEKWDAEKTNFYKNKKYIEEFSASDLAFIADNLDHELEAWLDGRAARFKGFKESAADIFDKD